MYRAPVSRATKSRPSLPTPPGYDRNIETTPNARLDHLALSTPPNPPTLKRVVRDGRTFSYFFY